MRHAILPLLIGLVLGTVGCGSDSTEGPRDAATSKDAPAGSDVLALADARDLPSASPETMPDLPVRKDGPVAYDVTKVDVTAVDTADAPAKDVADAPAALDTTADAVAVDQGSTLDGDGQTLDAQTVDVSALPSVTSFPCRDESDCCITVDTCMGRAYLYSRGPGGAPAAIPPSTGMCLPCIAPSVQVTCVSGQCLGTRVSDYTSALAKSHCGYLALADAGAHAPQKTDAGAPTKKSVWTCSE